MKHWSPFDPRSISEGAPKTCTPRRAPPSQRNDSARETSQKDTSAQRGRKLRQTRLSTKYEYIAQSKTMQQTRPLRKATYSLQAARNNPFAKYSCREALAATERVVYIRTKRYEVFSAGQITLP